MTQELCKHFPALKWTLRVKIVCFNLFLYNADPYVYPRSEDPNYEAYLVSVNLVSQLFWKHSVICYTRHFVFFINPAWSERAIVSLQVA